MRRKKQAGPITAFVCGLIAVFVGYSFAYYFGTDTIEMAKKSKSWPAVEGVIESSRIANSDGMYSTDIRYSYIVNGQTYRSSNVWFGGDIRSSNSKPATETVDRYPSGKRVSVHYDPLHPEIAVLEPGAFFSTYFTFLIGWTFLLGGSYLLAFPILKLLLIQAKIAIAASYALRRRD